MHFHNKKLTSGTTLIRIINSDGYAFNIKVHIVNNLSHDAIIGCDVLESINANIDIPSKTLRFKIENSSYNCLYILV